MNCTISSLFPTQLNIKPHFYLTASLKCRSEQMAGYLKGWLWWHIHTTQGGDGPALRPPQGPDVRLPEIVTFRRGEAAARAVIGPLTKTRRRTKTCLRLRWSVCGIIVLRQSGSIISPWVSHLHHGPPFWIQNLAWCWKWMLSRPRTEPRRPHCHGFTSTETISCCGDDRGGRASDWVNALMAQCMCGRTFTFIADAAVLRGLVTGEAE